MNSSDYEYSKEKFVKYSIASFLLVCASAFILGAGFQFYDRYDIHRNGIYTIGTVTEIEHVINTDNDAYAFKVKFLYGKHEYQVENQNKTGDENRYRLNEKVRVGFIPSAPEKAIIDDPREQEYTVGLLMPGGIGLLTLCLAFIVIKRVRISF